MQTANKLIKDDAMSWRRLILFIHLVI